MMKNKSTLAKLLAEEDIFVVHKQMETAYFNSKSRELGLPIWNDEKMTKDIYDLMCGHETGHALWTPLDMLETAKVRGLNHGFVNILEDVRIDKKVKNKYPGLVGIYNRGYIDLANMDFFGTVDKDINKLNLIDRINLFFKGNKNVLFSDEEKVWVNRAATTKTPDDVLDLAEELYPYMAENMPDEDEESVPNAAGSGENNSGEGDDTGNGESFDVDGSNAGYGDSDDENSEDKSAATGEDDSEDKSGSSEKTSEASDVEGGNKSTSKGGAPVAETDNASKKGLDDLRDKSADDRIYARIPKVDLDNIIIDTKTLLDEWYGHYLHEKASNLGNLYFDRTLVAVEALKNESKSTVAYMVKEFEMKKAADQYARAATSKTGSLDMGKLHTYTYNEDLFKKVTTLPGATNHGLVMVMDWSGSMCDNLKGTLAQLFNLIWFCRRTKIPFEVFAFSDQYDSTRYYDSDLYTSRCDSEQFKAGDLALSPNFRLLNMFSNRMSVADEMSMMHILWMYATKYARYRNWNENGYPYQPPHTLHLGGTPLNEAVISMMDFVPKYKNESGLQKVHTIFLTDGASNRLPGIYDYRLENDGSHTQIKTPIHITMRRSERPTMMITDPVTNKTYESKGSSPTNTLLTMLKNRVSGMNIVGFFIAGSGKSGRVDKRTLSYVTGIYAWDDKFKTLIKFINKNKYLAITQLGYDEYYVLPGGNSLEVENETLSDDLVGAGKAKLKSAFGKMQKGKISSRQLLNKFVSMVA